MADSDFAEMHEALTKAARDPAMREEVKRTLIAKGVPLHQVTRVLAQVAAGRFTLSQKTQPHTAHDREDD